jgi:hypothetical protein
MSEIKFGELPEGVDKEQGDRVAHDPNRERTPDEPRMHHRCSHRRRTTVLVRLNIAPV